MSIIPSQYKNIAFSSQFRYERVASKGQISYNLGTNPYYNYSLFTIPHNLGYIPFFRIFIQLPGSSILFYKASGSSTYGLVGTYQIDEIYADANNLYVGIENYEDTAGTGKIYYRIYEEEQAV